VKVHNWSTPREVTFNRRYIRFQVATCFPCATCLAREQQMQEKIPLCVQWEKEIKEKFLYFKFPFSISDPSFTSEDVRFFLWTIFAKLPLKCAGPETTIKKSLLSELKPALRNDWISNLAQLHALAPKASKRFSIPCLVAILQSSRSTHLGPFSLPNAVKSLNQLDVQVNDWDLKNARLHGVKGPLASSLMTILTISNRDADLLLFMMSRLAHLLPHYPINHLEDLADRSAQASMAQVVQCLKDFGIWIQSWDGVPTGVFHETYV